MATEAELQRAELLAAHRAMGVFVEALGEELKSLGEATVMQALGGTEHVHHALVLGTQPGAIQFRIRFGAFDAVSWRDHLRTMMVNVLARRPSVG